MVYFKFPIYTYLLSGFTAHTQQVPQLYNWNLKMESKKAQVGSEYPIAITGVTAIKK